MMLLLGCVGTEDPLDSAADTDATVVTEYNLDWSTDPEPLAAASEGTFTIQVTDQDGHPIDDLQMNHERMVHTMFVSADWTSFSHLHHEDFADLNVDDIREATFHFPLRLPLAGPYFMMFGYAHANRWLFAEDRMEVGGAPVQASAPDTTATDQVVVDDLVVSLTWNSEPLAEYESSWNVHITEADGTPVEDLVQYLGADAHCALVNESVTWGSHTHAWFPDMDAMAPGMDMPHLFPGPDVPFAYTFPAGGNYKMWIQFARESTPGRVYEAPFVFKVAG